MIKEEYEQLPHILFKNETPGSGVILTDSLLSLFQTAYEFFFSLCLTLFLSLFLCLFLSPQIIFDENFLDLNWSLLYSVSNHWVGYVCFLIYVRLITIDFRQ